MSMAIINLIAIQFIIAAPLLLDYQDSSSTSCIARIAHSRAFLYRFRHRNRRGRRVIRNFLPNVMVFAVYCSTAIIFAAFVQGKLAETNWWSRIIGPAPYQHYIRWIIQQNYDWPIFFYSYPQQIVALKTSIYHCSHDRLKLFHIHLYSERSHHTSTRTP